MRPRHLTVIIVAAGMGRRIKSYGPKSLIKIGGGETVVSNQVSTIRELYPNAEIVVVIGHEAEVVSKYLRQFDVKVVENENFHITGATRSILLGLRVASYSNVLIVHGDIIFDTEALSGLATGPSSVLLDSMCQLDDEVVGVSTIGNKVVHFDYGLKTKWSQLAFLKGRELDLLHRFVSTKANASTITFEALNYIIDSGGQFRVDEPFGMMIAEVGSRRGLERARRICGY